MLTILTAATLAMALVPGRTSPGDPLANYRWERRLVLIFAPEHSDAVEQQGDLLQAEQAGADDRDIEVLTVVGNIVSDGHSPAAVPPANALRAKFRIDEAAPFTVILVGKDGGEKLRSTEPVGAEDLFDLIDSMPMRQSEIRD